LPGKIRVKGGAVFAPSMPRSYFDMKNPRSGL